MTEDKPKIALVIPIKMKNILEYLVRSKPKEWTAFGKLEPVEMEGYTAYRLEEIDFPKQTNTGSGTDVSAEDFATFAEQLHAKKEPLQKWKLWIHSHNTLGAFWSGTDKAQMESFKSGSFMMSLVVSTTGFKAAFNLFTPLRGDFDCAIHYEYEMTPDDEIKGYSDRLLAVETIKEPSYYKGTKYHNHSNQSIWGDDSEDYYLNRGHGFLGGDIPPVAKAPKDFTEAEAVDFYDYLMDGWSPYQAETLIREVREEKKEKKKIP